MNQFERKSRYSFIKTFSLIYHRFIDDIFFIGPGCKIDLENFLNELNIKTKYFERKQTAKPFPISIQSIQNR